MAVVERDLQTVAAVQCSFGANNQIPWVSPLGGPSGEISGFEVVREDVYQRP
jgi:hypothetical protein